VSNTEKSENIIYTDSVSYPFDLPEPIQERSWYQRWARRLVAFVFVLATFFLFGGIYQLSLVQQTPEDTPPGTYTTLVDEPKRDIPTSVYVLKEEGDEHKNIDKLLAKANAILKQAAVRLSLQQTETISAESLSKKGKRIAGSPAALRDQLPSLDPNYLNIVVTSGLTGVNGVAFVGRDVVAVAEYNATFDFRVLAHEVGHILSLRHTPDRRNLMRSGGFGTQLNQKQALQAYQEAGRFLTDS
jgi:hypothetical protein